MQGIDRMMDRKAERGEWPESTALQVGVVATIEGSTTAGGHSHALAPTNVHTHAHALTCTHTCSSTHALASSCNGRFGITVVVAKRKNVPREQERKRAMICHATKQQSTRRYIVFVDCVFFIHAQDNSRKEDSALSVRGRAAVDLDLCGKNASRSRAAAEWFFKQTFPRSYQ